jgi:Fe-S oxidoreductase
VKLSTSLKEIQGAASLCIKCAGCTYAEWPETHVLCPIYSRDECFTFSGGGLLYLIKALADRKVDFSQPIAELLATCTSCGACDSRCGIIRSQAPYVNPLDIVRLARRESLQRGFIPEKLARHMAAEVQDTGDFGHKSRLKLSAKIKSEKANTVLFAECFHTKAQNRIADSVASLLEKLASPVALFAEKGCCGSSLYDFGFWDQLGLLVEAQWRKMKPLKNKTFIFLSPHCQEFVLKRYREILPDYKEIEARHFSQVLAQAFKDGKLKSKKGRQVEVSYHDPCYLGRGLGIYDAPREVISSLKGVRLVEMERNKQNSFCCGARALGNYMPGMNEWAAKARLKEFEATGADLLITACPYCADNFQKVLGANEKDRVKDLFALVDEWT